MHSSNCSLNNYDKNHLGCIENKKWRKTSQIRVDFQHFFPTSSFKCFPHFVKIQQQQTKNTSHKRIPPDDGKINPHTKYFIFYACAGYSISESTQWFLYKYFLFLFSALISLLLLLLIFSSYFISMRNTKKKIFFIYFLMEDFSTQSTPTHT